MASKSDSLPPSSWPKPPLEILLSRDCGHGKHLDVLLGQGATQEIRDEIISLSERFKIMTPYTSLLVLESDADRERFKVKRRFQMRDGERYFAEGRDQASIELKRKHMQLAGTWRLELREQILSELKKQGRNVKLNAGSPVRRNALFGLREQRAPVAFAPEIGAFGEYEEDEKHYSSAKSVTAFSPPEEDFSDPSDDSLFPSDPFSSKGHSNLFSRATSSDDPFGGGASGGGDDAFNEAFQDEPVTPDELFASEAIPTPSEPISSSSLTGGLRSGSPTRSRPAAAAPIFGAPVGGAGRPSYSFGYDPPEIPQTYHGGGFGSSSFPMTPANPTAFSLAADGDLSAYAYSSVTALPLVPDPISAIEEYKKPEGVPEELVEFERELSSRSKTLAEAQVYLEFVTNKRVKDQATTPFNESRDLVSNKAWLIRESSDWGPTSIEWCDSKQRAQVSRTFGLGTRRASVPADLGFPLQHHTRRLFRDESDLVRIEERDGNLLTFVIEDEDQDELQLYVIDTQRNLIVKEQEWFEGELYWETEYLDPVKVAGFWWPSRMIDREFEWGNLIDERETLIETKQLTEHEFDTAWKAEIADLDDAFVIDLPLPNLDIAQDRVRLGKAEIADLLTLTSQHIADDRWDEARKSFEDVRARIGDQAGLPWLNIMFHQQAGDNQTVHKLVESAARELTKSDPLPDELAIARFLMSALQSGEGDRRALHKILKPIYVRQPERAGALKEWRLNQAELEPSPERELRMVKELSLEFPGEVHIQLRLAILLAENRQRPEAIELLRTLLAGNALVGELEDESHELLAEMLGDELRFDEQRDLLAVWSEATPDRWTDAQEQYLKALVFDDDVAAADRLVRSWLTNPDPKEAELGAAADYVTRRLFDSYRQQIAPEWLPTVEAMIISQADNAEKLILTFGKFRHYLERTSTANRLAEHFRNLLNNADLETDTNLLVVYAVIASQTRSEGHATPFKTAVALIEKQIAAAENSRDRVRRIRLASDFIYNNEELLAFYDRVLPLLEPQDAAKFSSEVFECLIDGEFNAARLGRALSLIDKTNTVTQIIAHHESINEWLFKGVLSKSYTEEAAAIKKLTPAGQKAAKANLRAQARRQVIEHLTAQLERDGNEVPPSRPRVDRTRDRTRTTPASRE